MRRALVAPLVLLVACSSEIPTTPRPSPASIPTAPIPAPPPSPIPSAEPGSANNPPSVRITGGGRCHPSPSRPCTVNFVAVFSDPDGDNVRLEWGGCASGNNARSTCVVDRPGTHTATVEARDGHGNVDRASGTAQGTNEAPIVTIGGPRPPNPAPANTTYSIAGGEPTDPDGDEAPNALCPEARVTATGPCRTSGIVLCGGVGDTFDFDFRTLAGPGTCTIEARASDSWGAVGRARFSFNVSP